MNLKTWRVAAIIMAHAWLAGRATPAGAVAELSYTIAQDGYTNGASVTGSFSGVDLDNNGLLVHFPSPGGGPPIAFEELTAFSMHFSGNSLSPAFDLTLDNLYGFVYQVGTPAIGDDPAYDPTLNQNLIEGIGAIGPVHFYTSGLGPNGFLGGQVGGQIDLGNLGNIGAQALDSSGSVVVVTAVPEPNAVYLTGSWLFGLLASGLRKKLTDFIPLHRHGQIAAGDGHIKMDRGIPHLGERPAVCQRVADELL